MTMIQISGGGRVRKCKLIESGSQTIAECSTPPSNTHPFLNPTQMSPTHFTL